MNLRGHPATAPCRGILWKPELQHQEQSSLWPCRVALSRKQQKREELTKLYRSHEDLQPLKNEGVRPKSTDLFMEKANCRNQCGINLFLTEWGVTVCVCVCVCVCARALYICGVWCVVHSCVCSVWMRKKENVITCYLTSSSYDWSRETSHFLSVLLYCLTQYNKHLLY